MTLHMGGLQEQMEGCRDDPAFRVGKRLHRWHYWLRYWVTRWLLS